VKNGENEKGSSPKKSGYSSFKRGTRGGRKRESRGQYEKNQRLCKGRTVEVTKVFEVLSATREDGGKIIRKPCTSWEVLGWGGSETKTNTDFHILAETDTNLQQDGAGILSEFEERFQEWQGKSWTEQGETLFYQFPGGLNSNNQGK